MIESGLCVSGISLPAGEDVLVIEAAFVRLFCLLLVGVFVPSVEVLMAFPDWVLVWSDRRLEE
jgi:hypothetical protein